METEKTLQQKIAERKALLAKRQELSATDGFDLTKAFDKDDQFHFSDIELNEYQQKLIVILEVLGFEVKDSNTDDGVGKVLYSLNRWSKKLHVILNDLGFAKVFDSTNEVKFIGENLVSEKSIIAIAEGVLK